MIVVTGATGNVGRHVVTEVTAAGHPVRAVTRSATGAPPAPGAQVVEANPADPETMEEALDGASALFLNYSAVRDATPQLLALAKKRGVRRVVLLSSAAIEREPGAPANPIAQLHRTLEEAVEESGLDWTFLRPDMFAVNTIRFWGAQIRDHGVVRAAYGDAALAPIDERDVAAVAATALTDPSRRHVGQRYLLTGPEALTQRRMVELIGAALGRPLRFEELTRDQAVAEMAGLGVPEPVAQGLLTMHEGFTREPMPVAPPTRLITRKPAHTFEQWARLHVPDFTAA
ncbi:NAD(P)H-binding protein [Streptomyces sp. NPDC046727]|uniref:NAD(P)H-binding protein n=1 Tax=Streptomyces sp. NPDC046727 TaxID=3155373 RepID=UPI0033F7CE9F